MPKYSKEDLEELLWLRGNLDFKLRDYQQPIEDAFASRGYEKFFVLNCARRFGKTFWLCKKVVEKLLTCKNPLPRGFITSSTVVNLKRYIIPTMRILLEGAPPEIFAGWGKEQGGYMSSERKFVFTSIYGEMCELYLLGMDKDPGGVRGNWSDIYGIDEAGEVANLEYLYSSVIMPTFRGREGACLIMSSTPSVTPAHPFMDFCLKAQEMNSYIELNILQNPTISPQEREDIYKNECLTESDYLREYMCQHVVDQNVAIIPEYSLSVEEPYEVPAYIDHLHRYVSMDIGVKVDLTAILYAYYDFPNDMLVIVDEQDINGPSMTTLDLKDMITSKEAQLWSIYGEPYRRIADTNNPLLLQDLSSRYNLPFSGAYKSSLHAMVNKLRTRIKQGGLRISPNCKKTIGSLKYGVWDKHRKQFDRSTVYGHFDHLAALIYLNYNLDTTTNPLPDVYDRSTQHSFTPPDASSNKQYGDLERAFRKRK